MRYELPPGLTDEEVIDALVQKYPELAEALEGRLKAAPTTKGPTTAIPVSKLL